MKVKRSQEGEEKKQMPLRILIVDDIHSVRTLVTQYLKKMEGVKVIGHAENGEEAVRVSEQLKPDIVLMDISLPDASGVDIARQIKSKLAGTSVYLWSAFEVGDYRDLRIESPADGFIQKSNLKPELLDMIRKELNKRNIIADNR